MENNQIVKLMTVSSVILNSLSQTGNQIKFFSKDNIILESIVKLNLESQTRTVAFKIVQAEVECEEGNIRYTAKEFSSGQGSLNRRGVDPRSLYGLPVELITDKEEIDRLWKQSTFC